MISVTDVPSLSHSLSGGSRTSRGGNITRTSASARNSAFSNPSADPTDSRTLPASCRRTLAYYTACPDKRHSSRLRPLLPTSPACLDWSLRACPSASISLPVSGRYGCGSLSAPFAVHMHGGAKRASGGQKVKPEAHATLIPAQPKGRLQKTKR